MLNKKTGLKMAVCLTASALASIFSAATSAAVIYDNTATSQDARTALTVEHGDIINFGGTAADRFITDIQFEYFLTPGSSGGETAQFSLYALDGGSVNGVNLPGTLLYSSGAFDISTGTTAEGYGSAQISDLAVLAPDSVAWTVTFGGLDGAEGAGLRFFTGTAVGSDPTFNGEHFTISREGDGTWNLLDHPDVTDNLAARFTAVPEPTTWALMLGGLAVLGFVRRRK